MYHNSLTILSNFELSEGQITFIIRKTNVILSFIRILSNKKMLALYISILQIGKILKNVLIKVWKLNKSIRVNKTKWLSLWFLLLLF